MSTLSATSTYAEIKAAYYDNASYTEDGSASKAKAFVTACRFLLLKLPKRSVLGQRHETEMDVALIQRQMDQAQSWIATSGSSSASSAVKHFSLETFRD